MNRFRRHRLRTALSLLAMVALLWSQLLMASHPACSLASMAMDGARATLAGHADPELAPCHSAAGTATQNFPICDTHCSRGDLSSDVGRVLHVPALAPLPAAPVASVQHLPQTPDAGQLPGPLRSWHRPTAHPASLLLI